MFSAIFLSLWWRAYFAVTNDGWHFFGAWRILHGEVPYRDYYLFIPPFHQLKLAGIIQLFGETLISAQIVGFAERLILAGVIYVWLRRLYGRASSALGVVFGLIVYYSASSETLSSMIHEAAAWAVFAGASAAAALARENRRSFWWAVAGLFAGVAFMTKQTSGAGIAVALFSVAGWRTIGPGATAQRKDFFALLAGWAVPIGLIALWLQTKGALTAFVDQVYISGPASKGSPAQILLRPLGMLVSDPWEMRLTLISLVAFAVLAWATKLRAEKRAGDSRRSIVFLAVGLALAMAAGVAIGLSGGFAIHPFLALVPVGVTLRLALLFALAVSIAAGLMRIGAGSRSTRANEQLFLLAWVSLWISIFSSLSWALMSIMALPAVPFVAAAALNASPGGLPAGAWRRLMAISMLGVVVYLVQAKLDRPFSWSGWTEPNIGKATETSELPLLRGLRLSPETKSFVETATATVRAQSTPEDAIFVFPHIPVFYLLSERRPATFGPVHFFDVCPDALARDDAARIRAHPPKVMLFFRHTEAEITTAEEVFRAGQPSGQRDLITAIEDLTRDGYSLVEELHTPITDREMQIWARRD